MSKHTLNKFQKNRKIKIMEICKHLQLRSINIHNTKTNSLTLLRKLEKGFNFDGKSANGVTVAIVYHCLPVNIKQSLLVPEFARINNTAETTLRDRLIEIRRFIGEEI